MDVSVTIISKNEIQHIEKCLESVRWASEIVLVDQFSTDGTAEFAKRFGANVFQEPWHGFAAQKNIAIDKAKGPWILSLDADERVTPLLSKEIDNIIHQKTSYNGYKIARKNFFCGQWIRYGGWYPDYNLRLFKKHTGYFQNREVHEKVIVDGKVGFLKQPLEHYTYSSVSDYLARLERYSRLAAKEMSGSKKIVHWNDLTLRPFYTFINMYLLRRGFLDGAAGFFLAVSYAYYNFLKYYRFYKKDF